MVGNLPLISPVNGKARMNCNIPRLYTLTNGNNHTPRVFSTKTQDFTPMFLKPVVEVQLFLKGSESSKDKNSESPSFKHFRPETSVGELLKILQIFSLISLLLKIICKSLSISPTEVSGQKCLKLGRFLSFYPHLIHCPKEKVVLQLQASEP